MERLKEIRVRSGKTQNEIAKALNIDRTTYNKYENGASNPTPDTLARIADFFHVSVDYFLGRTDDPAPAAAFSDIPNVRQVTKRKIPVLGEIACGKPIFADEQRDVYVSVTEELVCDYALIAKGDSMLPRIRDGDLVFIREMPVVPNGKIAAVLIDDEATLKRVFFDAENRKLMLIPDNPAYEPFMYVGEELQTVRIMGLAVAAQTRL